MRQAMRISGKKTFILAQIEFLQEFFAEITDFSAEIRRTLEIPPWHFRTALTERKWQMGQVLDH